jgi:hypothetical protein
MMASISKSIMSKALDTENYIFVTLKTHPTTISANKKYYIKSGR